MLVKLDDFLLTGRVLLQVEREVLFSFWTNGDKLFPGICSVCGRDIHQDAAAEEAASQAARGLELFEGNNELFIFQVDSLI